MAIMSRRYGARSPCPYCRKDAYLSTDDDPRMASRTSESVAFKERERRKMSPNVDQANNQSHPNANMGMASEPRMEEQSTS